MTLPVLQNLAPDTWLTLLGDIKIGQPLSHSDSCKLASIVALKGAGWTSPNPLVGAVFLDQDNCLLGFGAHEKYKHEHAEKNALQDVDLTKLKGGTAYVTLEPCAHQGHQPPCADLLGSLGLKTLFYGHQDPNPKVAGKGLQKLINAGVNCQKDSFLADISEHLVEVFFHQIQHKTPFVAMKVACSLDGKAAYPGDSRHFITGERSREYGHWLRQFYDAIVVGADTVIQDNPTLNVRREDLTPSHPLRIVLDPKGKAFKASLNLAHTQTQKTVWITCEEAPHIYGVQHIQLPLRGDKFDVDAILKSLWELGVQSLLLEGGSYLWESFLNEKAVQKLHLFQAPQILGAQGIAWSGRHAFKAPMMLKKTKTLSLDKDLLTEGTIDYGC